MSQALNEAAASASRPPDLRAVISALWVYPIKSCAGVAVQEALLLDTGLEFDRAWMVVDEHGVFLTQRELPRMALIRPQIKFHDMVLRAPGMLALHIALDQVEVPMRVRVWDDEVKAYDMGPIAAQWFSDFLGLKARLVRFDPEEKRVSSRLWTGEVQALNQFSDGYPLLLLSQASLAGLNDKLVAAGSAAVGIERFRANIILGPSGAAAEPAWNAHDEDRMNELQISTEQGLVKLQPVKPCARCPIPDIDPATAISSPQVGDMLRSYRQDPRLQGGLSFGMNAIVRQGDEHLLKLGQACWANYHFD